MKFLVTALTLTLTTLAFGQNIDFAHKNWDKIKAIGDYYGTSIANGCRQLAKDIPNGLTALVSLAHQNMSVLAETTKFTYKHPILTGTVLVVSTGAMIGAAKKLGMGDKIKSGIKNFADWF